MAHAPVGYVPQPTPEGVTEISRWLSVSDTTGLSASQMRPIPEGWQGRRGCPSARGDDNSKPASRPGEEFWHPFRMQETSPGIPHRWCRCAQPPANVCHLSGMELLANTGFVLTFRHMATMSCRLVLCIVIMTFALTDSLFGCPPFSPMSPTTEKLYEGRSLDDWREVIKSLDLQSPEAAAAVPGLMKIVEDEAAPGFTRRQAALTLGRIGAPAAKAVPLLERYATAPIGDGETSPPLWAVKSLALFGKVAAPATPALAGIVSAPSTAAAVRLMSIEALCRIGNAHPLALATVVNQLRLHEPCLGSGRVRSGEELDLVAACIESLELFRGDAESSVPVLLRYSEDREERVRRAVAVTLGAIGPRAIDAASRLAMMAVADRSLDVRDVAAVALGQIGGTEWLTRILNHPEAETRERAATGLGYAPSPDPATNAALAKARTDESPLVRIAAIEATQRLRPNPQLTAPAAAKEVAAPDRHVRLHAIRFLTKLGPQASPAIPELEQLRNHPEVQVRQSAEKLLEAIRRR